MLAQPGAVGAGLTPGMGQLDAGYSALGANKAGDALQGFNLLVVPQAQILGSDTAFGGDGSGFGKNQPGAANGTAAQMDQVPVICQPIDAGVLAHWRDRNAVKKGQLAQGIGFEQQTHGSPLIPVGRLQVLLKSLVDNTG